MFLPPIKTLINAMRYGVIDIGSNSVRLMISNGVNSGKKLVKNTRLAEGMDDKFNLHPVAIERTVAAVSFFVEEAKKECVDEIFIFATAAVRKANNKEQFTSKVKQSCGIDVDDVSGEQEAKLGCVGALFNGDGGIIDVGGASTEISVIKNREQVYTKSVDIGAVLIKDECGQNHDKVTAFVKREIKKFGIVPKTQFTAIGGTATSVASMLIGVEPYNPELVDGFLVGIKELSELSEMLNKTSVEERKKIKGLQPERAEVIAGGVTVLKELCTMLNIDQFRVSEKDNLEGYLIEKRGKYD